jgi:RNA polymerase sigma-70 factor, ECF subfamily
MSRCLDDHSLVEACRAGQTEAFGALVERYQDRLFQMIRRLGSPAEDAKDILQDTFLRAFQKLDQFHGESSFYTWVYRIAVNQALSGYRKRRTRSMLGWKSEQPLPPREEPVDDSVDADPTFSIERAERERMVQAALGQLGPEHRAVIVLKDFDGRRYEEISAILDVPVGTVRSRLHRARCELRDRLVSLVDLEAPARHSSSVAS